VPLSVQLLAEYESLTRGAGFVDVSDRTKLELRGADRVKFLNSFCTNDIKRLQPGESCEAFVCNVKGHVLAHINVLSRDAALWIDTVPGQGEKLAAHLDRYLIREDVQIVDRTAEFAAFVMAGGQAGKRAGEQAGGFSFGGAPEGRLIWLDKGMQPGGTVCSRESLEIVRIEQGYPWFGVDISDENLPQEVDRNQQAISFTKGCYLGQETVARIDALGHVNKNLCGVSFNGETVPVAGLELMMADKVVGLVTSACWSPKLGRPLALAYVRRGHQSPGTKLTSASGEATVVALPA
jgi:folate-binding protein YgfZ